MQPEPYSVGRLEVLLSLSKLLIPDFQKNDRGISWDGHVNVFESEKDKQTKDNLLFQVPVQIKGHEETKEDEDPYKSDIKISDLRNYQVKGGTIFLKVCANSNGKNEKIYYKAFLPGDVVDILIESQKQNKKRIALDHLPLTGDDSVDLGLVESIFLAFAKAMRLHTEGSSLRWADFSPVASLEKSFLGSSSERQSEDKHFPNEDSAERAARLISSVENNDTANRKQDVSEQSDSDGKTTRVIRNLFVGGLCIALFVLLGYWGMDTMRLHLPQVTVPADARYIQEDSLYYTKAPSCEKIGAMKLDGKQIEKTWRDLLIYKDKAGRYGFFCLKDQGDSGAIYSALEEIDGCDSFLMFAKRGKAPANTIDTVNGYGILRGDGTILLDAEWADFEVLNARYLVAYKANQISDDGKGQKTKSGVNCEISWIVYDTVKGEAVSDAYGNNRCNAIAWGDVLCYYSENILHRRLPSGVELSESAKLLKNGFYILQGSPKVSDVMRPDGSAVFSYDPNQFSVSYVKDGFCAEKKKENGESEWVVLNSMGLPNAEGFPRIVAIQWPFVVVETQQESTLSIFNEQYWLYYQDGTRLSKKQLSKGQLSEERLSTFIFYYKIYGKEEIDRSFELQSNGFTRKNLWLFRFDNDATSIDYNPWVIYDKTGSVVLEYHHDFLISQQAALVYEYRSEEKDGIHTYYCFRDKDFSIRGIEVGSGFVKHENAGGKWELIDTFSGETILQGYDNYLIADGSDSIYVIGMNHSESEATVYQIG